MFKKCSIIILLLAVLAGYVLYEEYKTDKEFFSGLVEVEEFIYVEGGDVDVSEIMLSGLEIQIPQSDIVVSLSKNAEGFYEADFTEGDQLGKVTLISEKTFKSDEGDSLIPFVLNYGGSGNFVYVGVWNNNLEHHESFFLGDRIMIEHISQTDSLVVIDYKTFGLWQSFSDDPDVPSQFVYDLAQDNYIGKYTNSNLDKMWVTEKQVLEIYPPIIALSGEAVSSWYFEGEFPFKITDNAGSVISESFVTAQGDWLNENLVPFTGQVQLPEGIEAGEYNIVFMNNDPSDEKQLENIFETKIKL